LSQPRLERGRTVFLDRDGTINKRPPEGEYVSYPESLELLPGAAEAIRMLEAHPAKAVVITNQQGIALEKMTEADLETVHERLVAELGRQGAHLDGIVHCPHRDGSCNCRKPATGMFERAVREIEGVQIEGGAMIGDSEIDIEAGRRLGLTTVRVGGPAGAAVADHAASSMLEAIRWLTGPP
jgi:D-glycero-D-manno-heptose 1,7-bisphosphate phosphatase